MCFVSRKRMCVPPMPYEVVFALHPTSVALLSTYRVAYPLRTLHSGPRESHSLGAKAVPAIQRIKDFKPVKPPPTQTPVPPDFSYIMNRYNTPSVKRDITASVCQYSTYNAAEIDNTSSAVVPVTVLQTSSPSTLQSRQSSDVHPSYRGTVLFRNVFDGQLPATDYPKVNVCGYSVYPRYYMTQFRSFTSSCSSYTLRWQRPGVGYVTSMLPKFFRYR